MYTDDLNLLQAQEWERDLRAELNKTSLSAARREQTEMDLSDILERIAALRR